MNAIFENAKLNDIRHIGIDGARDGGGDGVCYITQGILLTVVDTRHYSGHSGRGSGIASESLVYQNHCCTCHLVNQSK